MGKKEEIVWKYLLQNPTADAEEVARETQVSYMHVKKCMNKIGTPKEVLNAIKPLPKGLASRLTNGKAHESDWEAESQRDFFDIIDGGRDDPPSYSRQDVLTEAGNLSTLDVVRHRQILVSAKGIETILARANGGD